MPLSKSEILANATIIQQRLTVVNKTCQLIVVSKTQPEASIVPLLEAGYRHFGENRVQEAEAKWPALQERFPNTELHLIGPLQTNKVKQAVALFDVLQTVDRPLLAEALAKEMARSGKQKPCYIQVNTGEEPQKAGVLPAEASEFIHYCQRTLSLPIRGLMCIPPVHEPAAPHFAMLKALAEQHGLPNLSMGMTNDFEIAAQQGATHVRIGSAIFGGRGESQSTEFGVQ